MAGPRFINNPTIAVNASTFLKVIGFFCHLRRPIVKRIRGRPVRWAIPAMIEPIVMRTIKIKLKKTVFCGP